VYRTIKIEVHVPRSWLTFFKQKMQDRFASLSLVEAAAGIFVVREPAREIAAPR
jgi:hypothetical protein